MLILNNNCPIPKIPLATLKKAEGGILPATPYVNSVKPEVGDSTSPDDVRLGSPSEAHTIVSEAERVLRIINRSGCQLTQFDLETNIIFILTDSRRVC
jgi:hypothetical protein